MAEVKANKVGKVKGLGAVYQAFAPLPQQIISFMNEGIGFPFLVTPEQASAIRIAGLSNDYTRTCIAPIGVKGEKPILYRHSPLMSIPMASIAVKSHANGKFPAFDRVLYESVKEIADSESGLAPEDRTAQILQSTEDFDLTSEMDETRFSLGRNAADYFKKFKHTKIPLQNLPTGNLPKDECAVNYLWFGEPQGGSVLCCGDGVLDVGSWAFGVLVRSAEGASQSSGYSLTNVKNAIVTATPKTLEALGLTGIKDKLSGKLETDVLDILRAQ